jgi:hypothetical protein
MEYNLFIFPTVTSILEENGFDQVGRETVNLIKVESIKYINSILVQVQRFLFHIKQKLLTTSCVNEVLELHKLQQLFGYSKPLVYSKFAEENEKDLLC